jgi:hypothetical protein
MTLPPRRTAEATKEAPASQLPTIKPEGNGQVAPAAAARSTEPPLPQTPVANLTAAIAAIMTEIGSIPKEGYNQFHKYRYAKVGDIFDKLTPLLGKHGVIIIQDEISRGWIDKDSKFIRVTYRFTIAHKSGEVWPQQPQKSAIAQIFTEKGGTDDKAFNKTAVQARKYFAVDMFNIPTVDAEKDDLDAGPQAQQDAPYQQARAEAPPRQRAQTTQTQQKGPAPGSSRPEPYTIQIIKGEQPKDWATRYFKLMMASQSLAEVEAWDRINNETLTKVQDQDEATYTHLWNNYQSMRTKFGAKPEDKIEQLEPPVKMADEPDVFLKWLEQRAAQFTSMPPFNEWWNTVVEKGLEGAFPPDLEEAIKIFQRHEARIGAV